MRSEGSTILYMHRCLRPALTAVERKFQMPWIRIVLEEQGRTACIIRVFVLLVSYLLALVVHKAVPLDLICYTDFDLKREHNFRLQPYTRILLIEKDNREGS